MYATIAIWLFARANPNGWFDTYDLRKHARLKLFTDAFWRGARPPGYPLLLKAFGPASTALLWLQLALYIAAFMIVSWGLARRCVTPWVRVAAFTIVLFGSLSAGWFEWTHAWSTESLSLSLLLLPVGLVLVGALSRSRTRRQRSLAFVAVACSLAEWVALRDLNAAWLFVATAVTVLLAFALGATRRARLAALAAFAVACVAVTAVGSSSDAGRRWRYPLVNIIAQRVFADPIRLAHFVRTGMPDDEKTRCFDGAWASDCKSDFSGFEPWLTTRGAQVYARDLLNHPKRLFGEPLLHWKALLCGDRGDEPSSPPLTYYSDAKAGELRDAWGRIFLSKWKWLRSEAAAAMLLLLWAALRARLRLDGETAPLVVLAATVYPLLVLVWHGDAMETQRHAIVAMVCSRLALWGVLAVSVDRLWQNRSQPTRRT